MIKMKAIVKEETPLSLEGSFERVVNSSDTEKTGKQKNRRVRNTFRTIAELAGVVTIVMLLDKLGILTTIQAVLISEIVTCVMSFLAGRLFEVTNK